MELVGPFDNAGKMGHDEVYAPETTVYEAAQSFRGKLPDEPLRVDLRAPRPDGIFTDLEIRRGDEEVHLRLTNVDTSGEPPPDAAFTLPVPAGVTVEAL